MWEDLLGSGLSPLAACLFASGSFLLSFSCSHGRLFLCLPLCLCLVLGLCSASWQYDILWYLDTHFAGPLVKLQHCVACLQNAKANAKLFKGGDRRTESLELQKASELEVHPSLHKPSTHWLSLKQYITVPMRRTDSLLA